MAYTAGKAPDIKTLEEMIAFVNRELLAVQRASQSFPVLQLEPQYKEPTRPRPGMLAYADGTAWDPGSGEGVYVLKLDNTWAKL